MKKFASNNHKHLVWHPYTQMKDADFIKIESGEGAYVYDLDGNKYIDAISSWWTNLHGHSHPFIAEAIAAQAKKLEHVIFAGFTHQPAETFAEMLLKKIPHHTKVFFSDNGSTAVEAAVKMALQFHYNSGNSKTKIVCFRDAYHGDTFGSMSVSARGVFTQPFQKLLFEVEFIDTPVYENANDVLQQLNKLISDSNNNIAAFIFEPLVLGSSGMRMYAPETLNRLLALCKQHNIITIADEVMTGFGRTGKFFATDYCKLKPDIICLSKGITGGFLPFAATTCTQGIYDAFLSNEKTKMLFHGHSYTGNPLGCAAAVASLKLFETENTFEKIAAIEELHKKFCTVLKQNSKAKNVRCCGTIFAFEIESKNEDGYLNEIRDKAYQFFISHKIILRPLGNTIYILPPYCIKPDDLEFIYSVITDFLKEV
jgi:adenosylmethionine-8-amino-7-oxononanoate aminotransferase